jgi:hypothetical protein
MLEMLRPEVAGIGEDGTGWPFAFQELRCRGRKQRLGIAITEGGCLGTKLLILFLVLKNQYEHYEEEKEGSG